MEILDIVDEYGNPTGETVEREYAHANGVRHRTSHVWLVRRRPGTAGCDLAGGSDKISEREKDQGSVTKTANVQILLQKRCEGKDSFPGCYDISSAGHIPAGCGYVESALRELEEELGVTARVEELIECGDITIGWDERFYDKEFKDRQYSKIFIIWRDIDESDFRLQENEVESVLWMDFDDCMDAVKNDKIKHCIAVEELEIVKSGIEKSCDF